SAFFFQAEDGIRDFHVTGVQTCALPISGSLAVFRHPTEALHGDLGILGPEDILLLFSHSGSSQELLLMLPAARELCGKVVGNLGNPNGTLAKQVDCVIPACVSSEACSFNHSPNASY